MIFIPWSVGLSHNSAARLTTFLGFHPKNPFGAFPKGFLRFISMSLEPIIEWTRL
jgi:hypothetical protein